MRARELSDSNASQSGASAAARRSRREPKSKHQPKVTTGGEQINFLDPKVIAAFEKKPENKEETAN